MSERAPSEVWVWSHGWEPQHVAGASKYYLALDVQWIMTLALRDIEEGNHNGAHRRLSRFLGLEEDDA